MRQLPIPVQPPMPVQPPVPVRQPPMPVRQPHMPVSFLGDPPRPTYPNKQSLPFGIIQSETELSFRLIPSLTQSHTTTRSETVREEVILAKKGISQKKIIWCPECVKLQLRQVHKKTTNLFQAN